MEQQTVTTETPVPAPDPEAAKYEALRQQLDIKPEAEPEVEAQSEPEVQPEPEAQPAKPSYEELEEHSRKSAGALKEEREARRAAEAREQAIIKLARDTLAAQQKPAETKEEPAKVPDVLEDPIKHYDARIKQLEEQGQINAREAQQARQELEAHRQQQAIFARVRADDQAIRDPKNPGHRADYDEACIHLESMRIAQLDAMYPDDNPNMQHYANQHGFRTVPELKAAILQNDRQAVVMQALQLGKSTAQMYYELAEKVGYSPKTNGNIVTVDRGKQQMEATKRGRAASVSISGGGGGKGADNMNISELTALFDEDSDVALAIFRKMGEKGLLG